VAVVLCSCDAHLEQAAAADISIAFFYDKFKLPAHLQLLWLVLLGRLLSSAYLLPGLPATGARCTADSTSVTKRTIVHSANAVNGA
jgi:hypothetical protein